ncbi:MAG: galactose mutarotase [Herminiimonas sp.]|nr:galactose mutarotase [Herminiimonas sp.]
MQLSAGRSINQTSFGRLPDGSPATLFELTNARGMRVAVSNFGGIVTQIHVPDRDGRFADVVLGFDSLAPYPASTAYFGALIGRYANRIAGGHFTLDGASFQLTINDGVHHLHGGVTGFDKRLWHAAPVTGVDTVGLVLTLTSPAGEEGYPGNLWVTVHYALHDDNAFAVTYHAHCDQPTPVNLTQHSYFNLGAADAILDHALTLQAAAITPIDAGLIPTGARMAVDGTPFDFREPRTIGERISDPSDQLDFAGGYDHNFVLEKATSGTPTLAARVHEPRSGRVLELLTTEPGMQFYSGNFLDGSVIGKSRRHSHRSGFCLEPQHFPDAPNRPAFPDTILRPGVAYRSESVYRFLVVD